MELGALWRLFLCFRGEKRGWGGVFHYSRIKIVYKAKKVETNCWRL